MLKPLYLSRPGGADILPARGPARPVGESIHLSEGLSNSFLISTPEGRIVINTGMTFEGPVHRRSFDAVDDSPTRYVIFTQGHVDHIGGLDFFLDDKPEVIAQQNFSAQQDDDARIRDFRQARSMFAFGPAIEEAIAFFSAHPEAAASLGKKIEPTITFDDRKEIELGGLKLELLAVPGGETTDSLAIWLPGQQACFTGNLFSALFGHFPNLVTIRGDRYRDTTRFIESLDRIAALDPEVLFVGHHEPVRGRELIRAELARLRAAVLYVHDETVAGMNAGKDVHTLMREIQLPPELDVGQGYGKVAWSVRAIWETYVGWFHQRSTTELYGTPESSIHKDLVKLAGGPDAIAAHAQTKLTANEPLEALHLIEAALSGSPDHAHSLRVALAAHQALAKASINFWESSWLNKEVERLSAALDKAEAKQGDLS
jgi:alkyl sulfatase BDS1-like metallo-beta-lactamase superfamily hydrolase